MKVSNKDYSKVYTKVLNVNDLPEECFIIKNTERQALINTELQNNYNHSIVVRPIKVVLGEDGYYATSYGGKYPAIETFKELNNLNYKVYKIKDLNIINVMSDQSFHGNYKASLKHHNKIVNKLTK